MTLTIGRRITLGFALVLLLVALVAGLGYWALRQTSETYDTAMAGRRTLLAPAIQVESEIRGANVEDLRYLLDGTTTSTSAKAARVAKAKELIDNIVAAAPVGSTGPWRSVDSLTTVWSVAADDAAVQYRAGNAAEVKRIRTMRVQPARDELDRRISERVEWARVYSDSIATAGKSAATGAQSLPAPCPKCWYSNSRRRGMFQHGPCRGRDPRQEFQLPQHRDRTAVKETPRRGARASAGWCRFRSR